MWMSVDYVAVAEGAVSYTYLDVYKRQRRDRPLTHEELMHYVPSIFGEDRHTSRSERYAYIPTITVLESLQREGFQPFFACQTRVRDPGRRGYTKHMLRPVSYTHLFCE